MQTISTELDMLVANLGEEAARAMKRARNKERYRAAVERTWRMRPEVARLVLAHTNGIFIAKDERPRRGPDRDRDWWVFGIYLDDAMVRTEVDAWQSVLLQALHDEGISVDELRFLPAKWDMRTRKLFPEIAAGREEPAVGEGAAGGPWRGQDESRALDTVKKAVCLVFEDTEQAWAFLESVRGAALDEVLLRESTDPGSRRDGKTQGKRSYWLRLYVDDVAATEHLLGAYGEAIRSRAYRLGLRIRKIVVRQASANLAGQHAFYRQGPSRPLPRPGR